MSLTGRHSQHPHRKPVVNTNGLGVTEIQINLSKKQKQLAKKRKDGTEGITATDEERSLDDRLKDYNEMRGYDD